MWRLAWLSVVVLAIAPSTRTAREYFSELKDARAFNQYNDEYVCFRDDDVPSFVVLAKVDDMMDHMRKMGNVEWIEDGINILSQFKDGLMVENYRKGVSGGRNVFEVANSGRAFANRKDYSYEYAGDTPGKIVYSINWVTGRYRLKVYAYEKSKVLPAAEVTGKCEQLLPSSP